MLSNMKTHENWGWHGTVRVTIRYADGTEHVDEFPNLITNAGLNHLRGCLEGTVTDGQIHYVGLGTSSTAPAAGDTQLGAEVFRKAITAQIEGSAGVLTTRCIITPADAVGVAIAEIGWFAGSAATSSANTGTMIAHVLYSHTHTNVESIQIDRQDTI